MNYEQFIKLANQLIELVNDGWTISGCNNVFFDRDYTIVEISKCSSPKKPTLKCGRKNSFDFSLMFYNVHIGLDFTLEKYENNQCKLMRFDFNDGAYNLYN